MKTVEGPIRSEGMDSGSDMGILHFSQNDLYPRTFAFQVEIPAQDHGKALWIELRNFFKDEFGTFPSRPFPHMVEMGVEHHKPASVPLLLKYPIGAYPGKGRIPSLGGDLGGRGQPKGGFLQEIELVGIVENGGEFPSVVPVIAAHSKIGIGLQTPIDILQLMHKTLLGAKNIRGVKPELGDQKFLSVVPIVGNVAGIVVSDVVGH